MSVTYNIMDYIQLYEAVQATGTYDSVASAIQSGVAYQSGNAVITAFSSIAGGRGMPVISYDDALQVAKTAETLGASAAAVYTAAGTVLRNTATGVVKMAGTLTMTIPAVAAAAAPLAGVALGAGLYEANPSLWTKISQTLLPFCYEEGKVEAFCDFVVDAETGLVKPVVLIATSIVDALKNLFDKEGVDVHGHVEIDGVDGSHLYGNPIYEGQYWPGMGRAERDSSGVYYVPKNYPYTVAYISGRLKVGGRDMSGGFYMIGGYPEGTVPSDATYDQINRTLTGQTPPDPRVYPPTAGVSAPTTPVEPIVWPDTPIIVVPDPLGPDYQPIPVTPVTPALPPYTPPLPLPEHVPDPTPEEPPEEWPEEEPWPTVIPAPWTEPGTEPSPDTPYIPWPLPETKPDETTPKPDYWPTYPPSWPETYPTELPWPDSPQEWPLEVPWPELEPGTEPSWWPDGEPWPESPQEWPDDVPWPLPPIWPFPWPYPLPYPWPFPYPEPSPDPYPDPQKIEEPHERVDPIIDPWPTDWRDPYPDPRPEPDPYPDPSQPDPTPEPKPDPQPTPPPYPTPPDGTIDPPVPPIIPLPFSSTTGLISVYHPTQSELLAFANWLWVTWQDATIDKIWNNPFDGVITLFELYCTPTDVGRKTIRSGFLDSGVNSETISRYTEIDCGSIGVPEYFGNYLDYAPYSKCHIYLPFIGIVELNVDDIVGHGVNVTYKIDEYNGSCIAMVTVAKSTSVNGTDVDYSTIMYQFSGNCAVELPLSGGSQAAIKAGMLEAAAWGLGSVIGGIMSGGSPMSIGADMAYGAASAVHSLVSAKSSVQHSGSFGASYGAMGCKKPFIIVTRPKQIQVPNYNELYGYQAHKMVKVAECTGYLRCREVHVISPTASDEEKALIEQMMKEGVYVTE